MDGERFWHLAADDDDDARGGRRKKKEKNSTFSLSLSLSTTGSTADALEPAILTAHPCLRELEGWFCFVFLLAVTQTKQVKRRERKPLLQPQPPHRYKKMK